MPDSTFIPAFLLAYSDASFTNPHEVVLPDDPPDCTGQFTHMGAKYWGLETDRHCANAVVEGKDAYSFDDTKHHWFTIALKKRSVVDGITISTKWFTGNQVPAVSVFLVDELTQTEQQVLNRVPLKPDADHRFDVLGVSATELRVESYHEGGISRVNCFGTPADSQMPERPNLLADAKISHISNEHYGKPSDAVKGEREVMHMFGWESARGGYGERALFHLATPAIAQELVVDTYMHRLNPPLGCHAFGLLQADEDVTAVMAVAPRYKLVFENGHEVVPTNLKEYMQNRSYLKESVANPTRFEVVVHVPEGAPWKPLVAFGKLHADRYHRFAITGSAAISHLLYMHYPHGGIHGLKLLG